VTDDFLGQRTDALLGHHNGLVLLMRARFHRTIPQRLGFFLAAAVVIQVVPEELPVIEALVAVLPCRLLATASEACTAATYML
jgi:hypothetical protein